MPSNNLVDLVNQHMRHSPLEHGLDIKIGGPLQHAHHKLVMMGSASLLQESGLSGAKLMQRSQENAWT